MRIAAFLAMALVWGLTWIAVRWATEGTPPVFVAGLRFVLAASAFLLWCRVTRVPLRVAGWGRLVAASLLVNTGCYAFLFWGLTRAPTGLAAIVNMSLIPVLSMGIGALYGEERVTARRLASVALGSSGLALLLATRGSEGDRDGLAVVLGLAAVAVATLSYAWGAIISKPLVRAMPPLAVAFWETAIGGATLLAVSAVMERPGPAEIGALLQGRPLASLLFLVAAGSLVGFSAYLWLLREWGAFRAGLYAFVSPAVAVLVGAVALGERFGLLEAAGMVVMFAATALVAWPENAGKDLRRS